MIAECHLHPVSLREMTTPDWQDIRKLINTEESRCVHLALDYQPTLGSLAFVVRVSHRTILTNGTAARIVGNTSGAIYIGDHQIDPTQFPTSRDIIELETRIYQLATSEFGNSWLRALARRSRSQILERERRLSILRAHLRTTSKTGSTQHASIAAISSYLQQQGTGIWN